MNWICDYDVQKMEKKVRNCKIPRATDTVLECKYEDVNK